MSHSETLPRLAVSTAQLKLMSYGPRREIIATLANDADLSARELAGRLHRPVTGLYRHLELLLAAGLIRQSGQRPTQKRPEALFALAYATFSSVEATRTPEGRVAIAEAASRYASATARKFKHAIEAGTARLETRDANAGFRVVDLQLDSAGVVQFQALMTEFIVKARKLRVRERAGAETVSMTILFAPAP
jgi:hypothetical protein